MRTAPLKVRPVVCSCAASVPPLRGVCNAPFACQDDVDDAEGEAILKFFCPKALGIETRRLTAGSDHTEPFDVESPFVGRQRVFRGN